MIPRVSAPKVDGATPEDAAKATIEQFAQALLEDQRQTPAQFAGTGRGGRTPFDRTGQLVAGLYFKPASRTGLKSGLVGTIRAPNSRFADERVRDRFVDYVHRLWDTRGLGWTKAGR